MFLNTAADLPTHVLLHFELDDTMCTLPLKRITHPPPPQLTTGCTCRVKWSANREYEATVLCLGNVFITYLFTALFLHDAFQVMLACWPGQKMTMWYSMKGRQRK